MLFNNFKCCSKIISGLIVGLLVFGGLSFYSSPIYAETEAEISAKEEKLKAELSKVEKEIADQKNLLSNKQKETASIQRDIDILNYKINTAQLNIKKKKLEIERLGGDINDKVEYIGELNEKVGKNKVSLGELLRATKEIDENSFIELVMGNNNISDLSIEADRYYFVQQSMYKTLSDTRTTKNLTEQEKKKLEIRRNAETNAKKAIEEEKANIERLNAEKQVYLNMSKTQEGAYRAVIAEKEKQRAAIRSALFRLRNVQAITFGEALELAKQVSIATGVRAPFILAIITQESNLGQNVGTCNRPGDPPEKSWRVVMKPERDHAPFLRITKSLGLDTDTQPVSCPYMGGWGGAMGPAQFIPSTWAAYEARIAKATGNNPPNPWNPKDAFAASATYLSDLGAGAGTYTAERTAALKYYAGGNWANPKNAFYGDQVMKLVSTYEQQIKILQED
ncbi:MAG: lytic murein transglycosylase [Candidatus Paceibacterota bacterium]|jgi:membrane-bound lytic murein transglycosylase B